MARKKATTGQLSALVLRAVNRFYLGVVEGAPDLVTRLLKL
jgi:hypothetical protein